MDKTNKKEAMTSYEAGAISIGKRTELEELRSEFQRLSMENKILIKRIEECLEQIKAEMKEDGHV